MSNIATFETERHQFLYVGMDIHKDNHTAAATNCFGQNLLELEISNSEKDFDDLVARVERLSVSKNLKPVFGLEDSFMDMDCVWQNTFIKKDCQSKWSRPCWLTERVNTKRIQRNQIPWILGCARSSQSLDSKD